ncbi:hypothetical protein NX722_10665 [Endozoicomonas gorgoniicola]|uniref:Uncharacterized protein n=1 Tax=Endozoicomonas gorgoniicola TaxID=1234144 RepID=A0ABT3MUN0_9GAMM|nr:hypothetical protein [Endozoicomonas gorgoniicola]MCW7553087.1 hypothetical protein [Endozoicomonas gorgoniicola]
MGDEFFNRHRLQINVPYLVNGYRHNHYIEVRRAGRFFVEIPSEEPAGTPIYLHTGDRRFAKSKAEWLITPIVQFYLVHQMLNFIGNHGDLNNYQSSIDFKNGGFLQGVQGYIILDSSLRLARDTAEHLEVYYHHNPGGSSAKVFATFSAGAFLLEDVPIDAAHFTALAMQKSFIYSVVAGSFVDTLDENLWAPYFSESWFPSHGSVRNFKSKLASQFIRGPVLSAGLLQLDAVKGGAVSVPPAKRLITHKLMIKSSSGIRQFNEMLGQSIGGVTGRAIEWIPLNGLTVALTGVDGPEGSLKQTFVSEFQQQLGSHSHKQIRGVKDSYLTGNSQYMTFQVLNQVFMDFLIGTVMYLAADAVDIKFRGSTMISRRFGKGIGLSYATKTLGSCVTEWVTGCATDFVHDYVTDLSPEVASYFRRDYVLEIHHGLSPKAESGAQSGSMSHDVHDEL